MKKLFIGLLVVAAGAGTFYVLQKKKTETDHPIEKELLVGKWQIDSIYTPARDSSLLSLLAISPKDSSFYKYHYDFQKAGTVLHIPADSAKTDTSYYEWGKKNELLIKESAKDSTGEIFSVNKLSIDSLILQSKDSAVLVLTKWK